MSNQTTWTIDPSHTIVEFGIRHLMITTVKGRFGGVEGTIKGNPDDWTDAEVEVKIDAASVDTRNEDRDNHLRSADFFEVEKYPHLTYKSTKVTKTGENSYTIEGELTIRDVTKPVTLEAEYLGKAVDPWGNEKIGFSAKAKVNRKDFGLTWNAPLEAGGFLVGDEVNIELEVQAAKAAEA
ncbi:MAG: YceI family protein [Limnochordales bacterium]